MDAEDYSTYLHTFNLKAIGNGVIFTDDAELSE